VSGNSKELLVVIATGPLTSDALAGDLARRISRETLYFYDSISPIVSADSIDYEKFISEVDTSPK